MKISKIYTLTIILLILQLKAFLLIPVDAFYTINSNQQQILMVVIIVGGLFITKLRSFKLVNNYKYHIAFFLIYYAFELVRSGIENKQGLLNAFIASNFYIVILAYFLFNLFISKFGIKKLFNIIIILSAINIFLCWIQFLLLFAGKVFLHLNSENIRFGTIRINEISDSLVCMGILISFYEIITHTKHWVKLKYFVCIGGFSGCVFVGKGRVIIVALFVAGVIMLIDRYHKNFYSIIGIATIIVVFVLLFLATPVGRMFYWSMGDGENDTGSIRADEIEYYNEQTMNKLLVGVGFIRDIDDEMSDYLRNGGHWYTRTDVGIWGIANELGLIGAVWYIFVLLKMIGQLRFIKKSKDSNYCVLLGMITLILAYTPTMIMLNPYRITTFALFMSSIDCVYNINRSLKKGKEILPVIR